MTKESAIPMKEACVGASFIWLGKDEVAFGFLSSSDKERVKYIAQNHTLKVNKGMPILEKNEKGYFNYLDSGCTWITRNPT